MARKKTSSKRKKTNYRIVASKSSRLERLRIFLVRKPLLLATLVLFGGAGIYMLVDTYALRGGIPNENAARGLYYNGLKRADKGPCAGLFVAEQANENSTNACLHPDPGPDGVDLRERVKNIDKELEAQAAYDAANMPQEPEATVAEGKPAPRTAGGKVSGVSLGEIAGRNWKCIGTGTDGPRVRWLYAHKANETNRLSTVRDNIVSIAKRTNAVVYNSSMASGGTAQHIRYATNDKCALRIDAISITGDINNFGNIREQARAKGYNDLDRKFMVMVDGGTACGIGQIYYDDSSANTNSNNGGNMFAAIWKPCWNYAEPHELGHMLGGVQTSAPRATSTNHCKDEKDVMCYSGDGSGSSVSVVCTNNAKHWQYDCNNNDFYDRGTTDGYLSNHWNAAKNKYLTN